MKKLFEAIKNTLERGEDAVLVTVVGSSGSVPRGAGAHMLVTAQGRICSSIGGGAMENRAEQEALNALRTKSSRIQLFQLRKKQVEDLGMVCGGDVNVCFHYFSSGSDAMLKMVEDALAALEAGDGCWLVADLSDSAELMLYSEKKRAAEGVLPQELIQSLGYRPFQMEINGRLWYAEPLVRPEKVYIFGGGHVAQALVPVLAAVEFRCIVVEDRQEFCDVRLFPGVEEVRLVEMNQLKQSLNVGSEDYVCIMTRGHTNDALCEAFALATPAHYIGVIGSRKKTAFVNKALKEAGFTEADLKRITTPIGLSIKAETPAEIAVSIAAQLIQVRAERKSNAH